MRSAHLLILIVLVLQSRAQQPGDLDTSFAVGGKLVLEELGEVNEIASLTDGKMLLMVREWNATKVLRYDYDGTVDTTFADQGMLSWPYVARRMRVDAKERIYLIGNTDQQGIVVRFLSNGEIDPSYGVYGHVSMTFTDTMDFSIKFRDADIHADGRLIICGDNSWDEMVPSSLRALMFRLTNTGQMDETFMYGGASYFYGYSNTLPGPYGGTCTSYKYVGCPKVEIGPLEEVYLTLQTKIGHNCTPSAPDLIMSILRYMPNSIDNLVSGLFYSAIGYTARPVAIVPSITGIVATTCFTTYPVPFTNCRDQNFQPCSPTLEIYTPSPYSVIHYRGGVSDSQGHMLHSGTSQLYGQPYRITIHRTVTSDLSTDPEWGEEGFLHYNDARTTDQAALAIQADGKLLIGGIQNIEGIQRPIVLRFHNIPDPRARLQIRIMLGGPYNPMSGQMKDLLRFQGEIPLQDPYTTSGSIAIFSNYTNFLSTEVLETTGDSAVIDWVWLEALDPDDPEQVVAATSALVLSNGSVTSLDGRGPVDMNCGAGEYLLRVRHRNHLSVTLAEPITLGVEPAVVDLTDPATLTFGINAQKEFEGIMMLWPGDVNGNGNVKYVGSQNDRDPILNAIGGSTPTATTAGYLLEDVNLDGVVKYVGTANDRDIILQTIGGVVPTAVRVEQGP